MVIVKQAGVALILALLTMPVWAASLTNGDFSSGGGSWNNASSSGTATVVGGRAQLGTGVASDPFSSVFVQGDDGFFSFASPISLQSSAMYLNFDVAFVDLGSDSSETGGALFSDSLRVSLYDVVDPFRDILIDPLVDVSFGSTMSRLHFNIGSLAGRIIALSFELTDEDDGRNSRVLLDNITFTAKIDSAVVPLPPALFLMLAGVGLVSVAARKRATSTKKRDIEANISL